MITKFEDKAAIMYLITRGVPYETIAAIFLCRAYDVRSIAEKMRRRKRD